MTTDRTAPYRTCRGPVRAETRVRGSRFLATLEPCRSRQQADRLLEDHRRTHHDATHVCWAWRLRSEPEPGEASSDAGEPSGTAGVPMLGALQSEDLWDVIGVVVRWFGGTKLGRGGLVRAYRDALVSAVRRAEIVEHLPRCQVEVVAPLDRLGEVHRVLNGFDSEYGEQSVEEGGFHLVARLPARDLEALRMRLTEATQGTGTVRGPED